MTTEGGNWKELTRAATDGDLAIARYHLDGGIDPNYQHPEFLTTPLIEAARSGQVDAVKLLLKYKADPTLSSAWESCTAIEEAMKEKHHGIVDVLLTVLPESYENECLTIGVSGTYNRDLIAHFLTAGHCVFLVVGSEDLEDVNSLANNLREETKNKKLWVQLQSDLKEFFEGTDEWRPNAVDLWLHKSTTTEPIVKKLVSLWKPERNKKWKVPFRGEVPKILFLADSKSFVGEEPVREQLSWLLTSGDTRIKACAMLEPGTWWDSMTYSFWYQTWCESILDLLTGMARERDGGSAVGKVYTYSRRSVILPGVEGIDGGLQKGWKHDLATIDG